jgi:hypothetical protein
VSRSMSLTGSSVVSGADRFSLSRALGNCVPATGISGSESDRKVAWSNRKDSDAESCQSCSVNSRLGSLR